MQNILIDNDHVKFGYDEYLGKIFLHAEIYKWSKQLYFDYVKIFAAAMDYLKEQGYDKVFVSIPDNDEKLLKFETMFGFEIVFHDENLHAFLLSQEI